MQVAHGEELFEALFESEDAAFDAAGARAVGDAEGVAFGVVLVFEGEEGVEGVLLGGGGGGGHYLRNRVEDGLFFSFLFFSLDGCVV